MHRNQSVNVHQFAMSPRADIPRSSFTMQTSHKTTFDTGILYPVFIDEILPGDTYNLNATMFGRMANPLYPIMDNLYLDTFWFFVPNRLVWDNWERFNGAQDNPGDSTSFVVPTVESNTGGFFQGTIYDYFGIPCAGQVDAAETLSVNSLPLRGYNLIWNEWFRDQNLQDSVVVPKDDGPDNVGDFNLLRRGKRHDYFTACLPFLQKGAAVTVPLGTTANIIPKPGSVSTYAAPGFRSATDESTSTMSWSSADVIATGAPSNGTVTWGSDPGLLADLSTATAATINQLRQSFQIQKLLERDARGGTRYVEILRSHFGVVSPDARLQRPEYLGGNSTPINISPVSQTSETGTSPLGTQGAFATLVSRNGFTQSFVEHGYLFGLVAVRADLTYQQGLRRMWSRSTRFDFYWPAFAMLGEQAVLNKEIYCTGITAQDDAVFGYQERWAEYRYHPAYVTHRMKSYDPLTLDAWHLAQNFIGLPMLDDDFIVDRPPLARVLSGGTAEDGQQIIFDSFFNIKAARLMPLYSVPGMIDHF